MSRDRSRPDHAGMGFAARTGIQMIAWHGNSRLICGRGRENSLLPLLRVSQAFSLLDNHAALSDKMQDEAPQNRSPQETPQKPASQNRTVGTMELSIYWLPRLFV